MAKTTKPRRTRLNMRIPSELLSWGKGYVVAKNTNLTQLFVDYLTQLKEQRHGINGSSAGHRERHPARLQARS
jgi:hypothetical protein